MLHHNDQANREQRRCSIQSLFELHTLHLLRVLPTRLQDTKKSKNKCKTTSFEDIEIIAYLLKHGSSFFKGNVVALYPTLCPILSNFLRSFVIKIIKSDDQHVLHWSPDIWPIPLLTLKENFHFSSKDNKNRKIFHYRCEKLSLGFLQGSH